jgi:predicted kinase
MKHEFTEQRFDYSVGRHDAPELVITVGISGCGKSTWAKEEVYRSRGRVVRFNRDDMRALMFPKVEYNKANENVVRNWQMEGVRQALQSGRTVIVDDTNCIRQTRQKWEELAQQMRVRFRIVSFNVDAKECIARDKARGEACPSCGRTNGAMVGEGVIQRQRKDLGERVSEQPKKEYKLTRPYFERTEFLKNGGWAVRLPGAKWVLVDVDGTLADCFGSGTHSRPEVRNPYDESLVLNDRPWEPVCEMLRGLYPRFNVCVVSGRHDHCGDDTCDWLEMHAVPFDHILMRYSGDNRSDAIVKKEILDELAAVIGGVGNIEVVIDDRPRVCDMWRSHGIPVRQVHAGQVVENPEAATKHADGCPYESQKGYRKCPDCGALEWF